MIKNPFTKCFLFFLHQPMLMYAHDILHGLSFLPITVVPVQFFPPVVLNLYRTRTRTQYACCQEVDKRTLKLKPHKMKENIPWTDCIILTPYSVYGLLYEYNVPLR